MTERPRGVECGVDLEDRGPVVGAEETEHSCVKRRAYQAEGSAPRRCVLPATCFTRQFLQMRKGGTRVVCMYNGAPANHSLGLAGPGSATPECHSRAVALLHHALRNRPLAIG